MKKKTPTKVMVRVRGSTFGGLPKSDGLTRIIRGEDRSAVMVSAGVAWGEVEAVPLAGAKEGA